MDFNKLIPDFSAIGTTQWNKPYFNTKDLLWLVGAICAVLMVLFAFVPAWFSMTQEAGPISVTASRMGIGLWYGFFAFVGAVIAVYGLLYERYQFAFWGGVIALLFAFIGFFMVPSLTIEIAGISKEASSADVKASMGEAGVSYNRFGTLFTFIAALGTVICSFLKIQKQ